MVSNFLFLKNVQQMGKENILKMLVQDLRVSEKKTALSTLFSNHISVHTPSLAIDTNELLTYLSPLNIVHNPHDAYTTKLFFLRSINFLIHFSSLS